MITVITVEGKAKMVRQRDYMETDDKERCRGTVSNGGIVWGLEGVASPDIRTPDTLNARKGLENDDDYN